MVVRGISAGIYFVKNEQAMYTAPPLLSAGRCRWGSPKIATISSLSVHGPTNYDNKHNAYCNKHCDPLSNSPKVSDDNHKEFDEL